MNPELTVQPLDDTPHLLISSPRDEETFNQWLDVRRKYVEKQGWRSGYDWDEYDSNPETLHILMKCGESILTGMRLTPAGSYENTLSWSMLTPAMQEEARERLPDFGDYKMWDLTRLIACETGVRQNIDAFVQMFSAGLELSSNGASQPVWLFATTRPMYLFFKRYGIDSTEITRGRISPHDPSDSLYCFIDPTSCYDKIKRHPDTYKAVFQAAVRGSSLLQLSRRSNDG